MLWALLALALLLAAAAYLEYGDAARWLWKTRGMSDEAAARWLLDDALTQDRESQELPEDRE